MPVSVKVKSFINIKAIRKAIETDKKLLQKIADEIIDQIFKLAISKKRMTASKIEPLPELSTSYKGMKARGKADILKYAKSTNYKKKSKRSNLSFSGGLLKAIRAEVNFKAQEIKIGLKGRAIYGSKLDYDEIMDLLIDKVDENYNIFIVGNKLQRKLINELREELFKRLRKVNN